MCNYGAAPPISLGFCVQGEQTIGGHKQHGPQMGKAASFPLRLHRSPGCPGCPPPCPTNSIQPPFGETQGLLGALRLHPHTHTPHPTLVPIPQVTGSAACTTLAGLSGAHSAAAGPRWCCGVLRSLPTSGS